MNERFRRFGLRPSADRAVALRLACARRDAPLENALGYGRSRSVLATAVHEGARGKLGRHQPAEAGIRDAPAARAAARRIRPAVSAVPLRWRARGHELSFGAQHAWRALRRALRRE